VKRDLSITAFVRKDSEAGRDAEALAIRYRDANRHIHLEVVDPDEDPGRARQLDVTEFGTVVLRYGKRRADVPSTSEVQLTSAIVRLLRGSSPIACVLAGHNEPSIDDEGPEGLASFARLALRNGFRPVTRTAASEGLDGCDVVVLPGPRVPLAPVEERGLQTYLGDDGKVLVLADSLSTADLNPVLGDWGIRFLGGVVLDHGSNLSNDVSTPILTDFPSSNPVVDNVPSVMTPAAAGLAVPNADPRAGLHVSTLARSSNDSILAADPEDPSKGGFKGPVTVAAAADDSKVSGTNVHRTRLVVIGDVVMATNNAIGVLGNATMLGNALSWLAQDELLLTVGTHEPDDRPVVITPARRREAVAVTVVGVPALVLLLGGATLFLRRRRR
jgi:ABC-type uncharacterized transport system involved in gliding motility auxiliary subunit